MAARSATPRWLRRRVLRLLRFGLPLVALGILAMLFLWSRELLPRTPSPQLPLRALRIEAAGTNGLALTQPRISGATDRGEPFVVSADLAMPDGIDPKQIGLQRVQAEMKLASGQTLTIRADEGQVDLPSKRLTLTGNVHLISSDGRAVQARALMGDLMAARLYLTGGVSGAGPEGSFTAAEAQLDREGGGMLRLSGQVVMRLNPATIKSGTP